MATQHNTTQHNTTSRLRLLVLSLLSLTILCNISCQRETVSPTLNYNKSKTTGQDPISENSDILYRVGVSKLDAYGSSLNIKLDNGDSIVLQRLIKDGTETFSWVNKTGAAEKWTVTSTALIHQIDDFTSGESIDTVYISDGLATRPSLIQLDKITLNDQIQAAIHSVNVGGVSSFDKKVWPKPVPPCFVITVGCGLSFAEMKDLINRLAAASCDRSVSTFNIVYLHESATSLTADITCVPRNQN